MKCIPIGMTTVFISLVIVFPCRAEDATTLEQNDFNIPKPTQFAASLELFATNYRVYPAEAKKDGVPLQDAKGNVLSDPISEADYCLGGVEGTIITTLQGKTVTLNYHDLDKVSHVDCNSAIKKKGSLTPKEIKALEVMLYHRAKNQYGDGYKSRPLVPYRTIAVDTKVIKIGTIIYIPGAKEQPVILPNGKSVKHDGYFIAGDTGAKNAIVGYHIDIFCGLQKTCLESISSNKKTFKAFVVNPTELPEGYMKFLTSWSY